jgi:hypothetical protein
MQRNSIASRTAAATPLAGKSWEGTDIRWNGRVRMALVLLGAVCLGCGAKPRELPVVPVSGQLFFQSQPAAGALVVLHPLESTDSSLWPMGYPRGTVSADGSFQISTYRDGDGAPEGKYRVCALWTQRLDGAETGDPEDESPDLFQERYIDPARSTLDATVAGPSTELPRIDLK